MQKTNLIVITIVFLVSCTGSEVSTDISLFMKDNGKQTKEIQSDSNDLYHEIGHHGPAIENEFYALRLYFNNSGSIDVYSKSEQQLELKETLWYPDSIMQTNSYGSDQYKVGKTVGLGGIKLWNDNEIIDLVATKGRTARVRKQGSCSSMELIGYGIKYGNDLVDIMIEVSLCAGDRMAKVKAISLTGKEVEFVTGINFHKGQEVVEKDNYAIAWGFHPEDVAIEQIEIGAAFVFDEKMFEKRMRLKDQLVFISKPTLEMTNEITSACERDSEINRISKLEYFLVEKLKM